MPRAAIAGVALSECGTVPGVSPFALQAQAAHRALAETGLAPSDVDGLGSTATGALAPVEVAEYLGLRPTWIDSTSVGGASWEVMAAHAVDAIEQGHAHVVLLVYGSTARSDLRAGLRPANLTFGSRGPSQFETPYGHTLISKYAMAARRHMHDYGTTIEQLAKVAVDHRTNALPNPEAQERSPITIDDVFSGTMIADPFTKLHCCLRSDGGAAVVLVSEDRLSDVATPPVHILGSGDHTSHIAMSEWPDLTVSPAAISGRLAFGRAGVSPDEIDVCQIYDAFTYMVPVTLEDLGFCEKGEGGPFVEDHDLTYEGDFPVNTDGGGLSACHPGHRGLFLLVEAVRQLRGESGERQVDSPRLACVSATGGWFSAAATMILGI